MMNYEDEEAVVLICAENICPSEWNSNGNDTYIKDPYRTTYLLTASMMWKVRKSHPSCTHFEKLRQKYKKLATRIRSLEQPVWLFSSASDRWEGSCAKTCSCFFQKRLISCWHRNLRTIPSDQFIPYDVKTVDLAMNYMTTLHKDTFRALVKLEEIDLSYNKINYLPTNLFYGLESLIKLKLNGNRLREVPKRLFYGLDRLKIVDLSNNLLKNMPASLFQWTSSLASLFVQSNLMETLPSNIFRSLLHFEELDVSKNHLCMLHEDTFEGLSGLRFLKMDENKFVKLSPGLFKDNTNLNIVSLRKNQITTLNSLFQNLPALEYLDLASNRILQINDDDLMNTTILKEFNLHHNRIEWLDMEVFRNTKFLQKLIVSSNYVTELRFSGRGSEQLAYIDLRYNMLKRMHRDFFEKWSNISVILLQGNMLRNISKETLTLMSKLKRVTLANNLWKCDCNILPLSEWLRSNKRKISDYDNIECVEPTNWLGHLVSLLDSRDVCDVLNTRNRTHIIVHSNLFELTSTLRSRR